MVNYKQKDTMKQMYGKKKAEIWRKNWKKTGMTLHGKRSKQSTLYRTNGLISGSQHTVFQMAQLQPQGLCGDCGF